MNIYASNDYREIINEVMSEKKFLDKSFTFQAMANFLRIQKPYLSKVMNNRADLNSDQLYMCCKFLEMNAEEIDFIILLLEFERCTYPERKKELAKNIARIQDSKRDSKNVLIKNITTMSAIDFDQSELIEYYLEPTVQIVHMFLTIPRFKKNINDIATELSLPKDHFNEILQKLVNMKIIEIHNDKVNVVIQDMHLPRESKILVAHQQMLKQYAIQRMSRVKVENKKAFAVTFCSDEASRKKIEIEFNIFLSKVRNIAGEGEAKECYQMNFDLFPWSVPS